MIFFFISLSAEWWHKGNLLSWISIGTAMFAVIVLVGWCIWTARDRREYWWFQADPGPALLVNDQPKDDHETVEPRRPLIKRIIHFISAVLNKLNECHSARQRNGSVQDAEMQPVMPTGECSDLPGEDTGAYQQHGDTNFANRSPVVINIRQPTLPSGDVCTSPSCSSADVPPVL